MADVATLQLRIDSGQAKSAVGDLDRLTAAGGRAERSANGIRSAFASLRGVFAGVGVAALTRAAVQAGDAYNNLNARLQLVTGSTRDYVAAQQGLFAIAQRTGTGLEQTADLFGSLSRSTESLGVSQSKVLGVTETINQALAVSGASAQGAAAALVQLGQGFAAGALRGEELNSVLEQAPRLARAIADGLGVPIGQLRKLGEEGELTGERVFRALERSGASIAAEFNRLPLTVERASTQAGNALLKLIGTLNTTSGATSSLAGFIHGAATAFSDLADQITRVSQGNQGAGFLGGVAELLVNLIRNAKEFGATTKFEFESVAAVVRGLGREFSSFKALFTTGDLKSFTSSMKASLAEVSADISKARQVQQQEIKAARANTIPEIGQNDRRELARRGRSVQPFGVAVPDPITPKGPKGSKAKKSIPDVVGFDLAEIRRELDGLVSAYRGAETILEASRAAGLVDARSYYTARQQLINITADAEIRALEAENARIAKQKTDPKDELENRRKVLDNEAKIGAIRAEASAKLVVLGLQETSSLQKLAAAYEEAEAAAQSYLDTLRVQQERELDGLGRGTVARGRDAGRAQIEDRFQGQRDQLAGELRQGNVTEDQYAQELARIQRFQAAALQSFDAFYEARLAKERDFSVGASEALQNYMSEAANLAKQTEEVTSRALGGIEDAFVSLATTGKADFKSLANSIIADIIRMQARAQLAGLLEGISNAYFGNGAPADSQTGAQIRGRRAYGGPVGAGGIYEINERGTPEILNTGGKQYLLMAGKSGQVTPVASGGGSGGGAGAQVFLNIQGGPSTPKVSQRREGNKVTLDVIYEPIRDRLMGEVNNGGPFMSGLSAQTGVNRTAGLVR